jgi:Protein of unknown function (DUF3107)
MAATERVELELGFESGGLLRFLLPAQEAAELVQAYRRDPEGVVALDSDKGRVVVDLRRVAYVRELAPDRRVGFVG